MLKSAGLAIALLSTAYAICQTPPPAAFERGQVHYRVSFGGEIKAAPYEVRLAWDKAAVRKESIKGGTVDDPKVSHFSVIVGQDQLTFMQKDSVSFSRNLPLDFPGNPKYNLVARKPSMPLGSLVPGFPVVRKEGNRLIEAADSDKPNPFTKWVYEGSVDAGAGQVPRIATMTGNGSLVRYEIVSAKLGSLPNGDSLVPDWYRPGMEVNDFRVHPPVNWTYERLVSASGKEKGLTPDELLILSQQLAKEIQVGIDARKRRESAESARGQIWQAPLLVFVVVAGLGTLGYGLQRRLGRRS